MLQELVGSRSGARVLLYLHGRGEGYARQIARFFESPVRPIQKQLQKFEAAGILYSRRAGRTRLYRFDPRCPFLPELQALFDKALSFYPEDQRSALLMGRRRPRRAGKPL